MNIRVVNRLWNVDYAMHTANQRRTAVVEGKTIDDVREAVATFHDCRVDQLDFHAITRRYDWMIVEGCPS